MAPEGLMQSINRPVDLARLGRRGLAVEAALCHRFRIADFGNGSPRFRWVSRGGRVAAWSIARDGVAVRTPTTTEVEARVLDALDKHPGWGGRKLRRGSSAEDSRRPRGQHDHGDPARKNRLEFPLGAG